MTRSSFTPAPPAPNLNSVELLRNTLNPFHTGGTSSNTFDDEEEADSIFGATKTKNMTKLFGTSTPKPADPSKDLIMSRNTFNEDALIKKKPEVVVVETPVTVAKP